MDFAVLSLATLLTVLNSQQAAYDCLDASFILFSCVQISSLRDEYESGQEGWRAAMAERARKEVSERTAAIRDKLMQERNEEVEVRSFLGLERISRWRARILRPVCGGTQRVDKALTSQERMCVAHQGY